MSNTESTDTWSSLVLDLRARLSFHISGDRPPVTSEEAFRAAFGRLCRVHKESRGEQLYARIRRQHAPMIDFAATLDKSNRFEEADALAPLIWQLLTKATQAACALPRPLIEFVQDIARLNVQVPAIHLELLKLFAYDPRVQKPLIALFREYIECYLTMFAGFATAPPALHIRRFDARIQDVGQFFTRCTAEWETARKTAEEEEQRRMLSATNPSSPNGVMSGPLPSHGTNAQFRFVKRLGTGTYGEVSMVMLASSQQLFAQKTINVRDRHDVKARDHAERQVKNEYEIMKKLVHHHIAQVMFYVKDVASFSILMLPVADCDLRQFLEITCVQGGFPKHELSHLDAWFGSLVSALAFAHELSIKHEDIKPSNILIKDHHIYLADFGSAKDFSASETSVSEEVVLAGTPVYWPPETRDRGRPADIFALGCVFSEMLTVRQRRSLAEYRVARHMEGTDYGYAFRNNLEGVRNWLTSLEGAEKEDSIANLLLETCLEMLQHDKSARPLAKRIKRQLRTDEDLMFRPLC